MDDFYSKVKVIESHITSRMSTVVGTVVEIPVNVNVETKSTYMLNSVGRGGMPFSNPWLVELSDVSVSNNRSIVNL